MSIEESGGRRKYVLRNLIDRFSSAMARRREIMALDSREMDAIAHDLNLSSTDFEALSLKPPGRSSSLASRLAHAGLSDDELAVTHCDVLRDVQRVCGLCQSKARCARDLAHGRQATPAKYCPNEDTLRALASEARRNSQAQPFPTSGN